MNFPLVNNQLYFIMIQPIWIPKVWCDSISWEFSTAAQICTCWMPQWQMCCVYCSSCHTLREVLCNCILYRLYHVMRGLMWDYYILSLCHIQLHSSIWWKRFAPMWCDVTWHKQYLSYFDKCTELHSNKRTMKNQTWRLSEGLFDWMINAGSRVVLSSGLFFLHQVLNFTS